MPAFPLLRRSAAPWLALAALAALPGAAAPPQGLAAFGPVAGRCWSGDVGQGAVDTHCFAPVYGGAHLRDSHRVIVGGRTVYSGETLYSREGPRISFTYWNSLGGVGRGTATPVDGGIDFAMTMRGNPDEAEQAIASRWRWRQPDGYAVNDGAGKPVVFRRATGRAR